MADEANQGGSAAAGGTPAAGQGAAAVIVIKKKNRGGAHPHHGGAWKLAYADFVTAMMAFFLLLWLLSSTTPQQKMGIAHYFNPPNNATEYGGGTGIMGGESVVDAAAHAPKATPEVVQPVQQENEDLAVQATEDSLFRQVATQLQQAVMNVPQLQALMNNLHVDITPEGMRIQITDSQERPLFQNGSAEMMPYTKQMLSILAEVLARLPNQLAIGGHTDVVPYRGSNPNYTNWELSTDRAQASRKVLVAEGIVENRIARVAGYAGQDLMDKDNPQAVENRRISIIVLRAKKGPVAAFSEKGLIVPVINGPRVQ